MADDATEILVEELLKKYVNCLAMKQLLERKVKSYKPSQVDRKVSGSYNPLIETAVLSSSSVMESPLQTQMSILTDALL